MVGSHEAEESPTPEPPASESPAAGQPARPPGRRPSGKYAARARAKKVASAAVWILVIAIVQILFGVGFGVKNASDCDQALDHLEQFEATETVEVEGEEHVVADLRAQVERERIQGYVVPIGLGAVFLGLYFWARRAAVPAMVTALLLFVTVHAVAAVVDPSTLPRGIVLKALFIAGLVGGLKAALAQRDAERAAAESPA